MAKCSCSAYSRRSCRQQMQTRRRTCFIGARCVEELEGDGAVVNPIFLQGCDGDLDVKEDFIAVVVLTAAHLLVEIPEVVLDCLLTNSDTRLAALRVVDQHGLLVRLQRGVHQAADARSLRHIVRRQTAGTAERVQEGGFACATQPRRVESMADKRASGTSCAKVSTSYICCTLSDRCADVSKTNRRQSQPPCNTLQGLPDLVRASTATDSVCSRCLFLRE